MKSARLAYWIAFSLVCVLFVAFLVGGIYTLPSYGDIRWLLGPILLFCAVVLTPFAFWLGKKAFLKRTERQAEKDRDNGAW